MIPGPEANICVDCVRHANEMVTRHEKSAKDVPPLPPTPTPREIKSFLDQYVIGHDEVKKVLAVAVHNHYRRLEAAEKGNGTDGGSGTPAPQPAEKFTDVEIEKSNILLIGPTGTGKTLLARTLAKMLGVPFAIGDATVLTQAGYVGEDVENLVRYLLQNADGNVELAKRGIIYVDEIDNSRRCSRFSRGRSAASRRRAAESTPTRSTSRSTPPTSSSSAAARSSGSTESSASAPESAR